MSLFYNPSLCIEPLSFERIYLFLLSSLPLWPLTLPSDFETSLFFQSHLLNDLARSEIAISVVRDTQDSASDDIYRKSNLVPLVQSHKWKTRDSQLNHKLATYECVKRDIYLELTLYKCCYCLPLNPFLLRVS